MIKLLTIFLATVLLLSDEYDFDIDEVQPKNYEYSGYLRADNRGQKLSNDEYQNYLHCEALLEYKYFYDKLSFKTSLMATYDYLNDIQNESAFPINELYAELKLNTNQSLLAGKKSLKWGKGYFFNPVGFLDRPKDPSQPTQVREGYSLLKYSYNKSFRGDLKNLSFDVVYLPSSKDINKDLDQDSNNLGLKLYLLYFDTDIDLIYNYSDATKDRFGVDFSKNLQTNFEIHGEFAKVIDADESYLLGLRYLTEFELTIISEYIKDTNNHLITLLTQKEPLDILYFSIYAKNSTNTDDNSYQNKVGLNYALKNNIDADISYNKNSGDSQSEFGKKSVSDFLWLQVNWKY